MDKFYEEAGDRVRAMRVMRGYSRSQLAEMAEITPHFLYELEKGRKGFSALVLRKLCKALKVDSDYILTGKKRRLYDYRLLEAIQLFEENQTESVSLLLQQVYALMQIKSAEQQ